VGFTGPDLFVLALSVAAAPLGAAWLIRERKSARRRSMQAVGAAGTGERRGTVDAGKRTG
jgi:hypothetical protein